MTNPSPPILAIETLEGILSDARNLRHAFQLLRSTLPPSERVEAINAMTLKVEGGLAGLRTETEDACLWAPGKP
jgi:hypothetical protein